MSLIFEAVRQSLTLKLEHVPAEVLEQTKKIIADTFAVINAGSSLPEPKKLAQEYIDEGLLVLPEDAGKHFTSSVIIDGEIMRAHAETAAYLNATEGTFLELDEGMRPTGHPAIHIVPAALAVAEQYYRTGAELLRAVLVGYEVSSRLFQGIGLNYPIHPHGHVAGIGGAVAAGILAGVDPVEVARNYSTSPLFTIWDSCYEGATARNSWTGQAVASAIRSIKLTRAGFFGSFSNAEIAFSELTGFIRDEAALVRPLDYENLGITSNYFKFHSCCALNHAAVEATFGLVHNLSPEDVDRVVIETVENNMKINRLPTESSLSTRFSLPYSVAAVILTKESRQENFDYHQDTADFAQKIAVHQSEELQEFWPNSSPARVTIHLKDGEELINQVDNPKGHYLNPADPARLEEKFVDLGATNTAPNFNWNYFMNLETIDDVHNFFGVQ